MSNLRDQWAIHGAIERAEEARELAEKAVAYVHQECPRCPKIEKKLKLCNKWRRSGNRKLHLLRAAYQNARQDRDALKAEVERMDTLWEIQGRVLGYGCLGRYEERVCGSAGTCLLLNDCKKISKESKDE